MDLTAVKAHYAAKLAEFGNTPQGMDWKDDAAQMDRLHALCLLFGNEVHFSVNDWGCGYGHLSYLVATADYAGYDIVQQDIRGFVLASEPTRIADYTVASGLFNVMAGSRESWSEYVKDCFRVMDAKSRKGYGFNMLHTRADRKADGLFYASPEWCLTWLPSHDRVSILQHYSRWDFTILVHKC